ncbi:type I-E CRISPR-associated endoribonuclease Cas2e [Rothia terrae]|uniref:type I-E CRISPR-associated endoribonuclease Cas2e n=1 Tax=Rothia terrae TaxID=396015 RepID=UPI002882927A|nr:type I-E CRISPR-associated endoribonuclease Cas2e [Rothia terrae]MDT0189630.1 type I-E CRISPR-associated endoribonuclease Cas2e [Rothia terrae]
MIVVVLSSCPPALRGDLTRWLLEISSGVYVGKVNARIREHLWSRITSSVQSGRAIMVFSTNNEQGLDFKVHRHQWEPVDFDGVALMRRPTAESKKPAFVKKGWSNASKYRMGRRRSS